MAIIRQVTLYSVLLSRPLYFLLSLVTSQDIVNGIAPYMPAIWAQLPLLGILETVNFARPHDGRMSERSAALLREPTGRVGQSAECAQDRENAGHRASG